MGDAVHVSDVFGSTSSRILKTSETLSNLGYNVYVVTRNYKGLGDHNFIEQTKVINRKSDMLHYLDSLNVKIIVLHSLRMLLYSKAFKMRFPDSRIIYDAHELETETKGKVGKPLKKVISKIIERYFIKYIHTMWTVSDNINKWYRSRYATVSIATIYNYPKRENFDSNIIKKRIRLLEEGRINFVYQGKLAPGRFIPELIEIFKDCPDYCFLEIYGFGPLENWVRSVAKEETQINFRGKVLPEELAKSMLKMHVGFSLLDQNCLNHKYAMPNKLFSYVNNRIFTIAISGTDQAEFLESNGFGMGVGEDLKDLREIFTRPALILEYYERVKVNNFFYTWDLNKFTL